MARLYQGAFNSGELDPGMYGRVDIERYRSALRLALNGFPLPQGGFMKRPGLEFIGYEFDGADADMRLIPFEFNNEQTYIVVLQGDRVWILKDGAVVLNDMDALGGTGTPTVGQDGSGVYINYTSHGYNAGTRIFWIEGGYEELRGRWLVVAGSPLPTANRFYVRGYLDLFTALDGSGYTADAATIDFGEIYSLVDTDGWGDDGGGTPPYAAVPVGEIDYTQANNKLYLAHPSGPTKVVTRTSDNAWTIENFDPAPTISTPSNLVEVSSTAGPDDWRYAVTALDPDTFEESIAALLTVTAAEPLLGGNEITIGWDEQTAEGVAKYRVYRAISGIYGLIGTVEDPNPGAGGDTLEFVDEGFTPNLSIAPPLEADFFGETDKYPGAVELFQNRIWFGRTNELIRDIYGSRAGSLSSFATSTVAVDDDPIEQAISAKSVQEVKHFVPLKGLAILTTDAEWYFDTGDLGVITPNAGLDSASFWGSEGVKPVLAGDAAVFVEKGGRAVRDLAYAIQADGFASSDLSIFANHLFRGRTVIRMCYSNTPFRTLFCVMSDGSALSCTYVRDQQIFAWAQHRTRGRFLDCAAVTEGGIDNIYCVIERTNEARQYRQIERMRMIDPTYADQGVWLDNHTEIGATRFPWFATTGSFSAVRTQDGLLQVRISFAAYGSLHNTLVRLSCSATSAVAQLDGLAFFLEFDEADAGVPALRWYTANRVIDDDAATAAAFDSLLVLPDGSYEVVTGCTFTTASGTLRAAHQLVHRAGLVSVRADDTMYEGLTVPDGGVYEFSASQDAAVIHAGETYRCELETLDIDSPQDPITGLYVSLSGVVVRFAFCSQFMLGRRRASLVSIDVAELFAEEDWDQSLKTFQGVFNVTPFAAWQRDARLVLRSEDGFPFKVTAIVPIIGAGDLDA